MTLLQALRPFARGRRERAPGDGERCEICASRIEPGHPHVLRLEPRSVLCACGACAALFRDASASGARYRTVPERVLVDDRAVAAGDRWGAAGIPVGLAFFVLDSRAAVCTSFFPSPGGPIRTELPPEAWQSVLATLPLARELQADVEGLVVHRTRAGRTRCLIAPIDECYRLAATVRTHWRGFDGGDEVREAVAAALDGLQARARPAAAVHDPEAAT